MSLVKPERLNAGFYSGARFPTGYNVYPKSPVLYGTIFPLSKTHSPRKHRLEVEVTLWRSTPRNNFGEFELPGLTLVSLGIAVLVLSALTLLADDSVKSY